MGAPLTDHGKQHRSQGTNRLFILLIRHEDELWRGHFDLALGSLFWRRFGKWGSLILLLMPSSLDANGLGGRDGAYRQTRRALLDAGLVDGDVIATRLRLVDQRYATAVDRALEWLALRPAR